MWRSSLLLVGSLLLAGCSEVQTLLATPTPTPGPTPTSAELTLRLSLLAPRDGLPSGFRFESGRYEPNQSIIAQAPDPVSTGDLVQRWGRVIGYVATYAPLDLVEGQGFQVSLDLYRTAGGARAAFQEGPSAPPGAVVDRSAVTLLGDESLGFRLRDNSGEVIFYADSRTGSMQRAMDETNRRRAVQEAHNREHGIVPRSVTKSWCTVGSGRDVLRACLCLLRAVIWPVLSNN